MGFRTGRVRRDLKMQQFTARSRPTSRLRLNYGTPRVPCPRRRRSLFYPDHEYMINYCRRWTGTILWFVDKTECGGASPPFELGNCEPLRPLIVVVILECATRAIVSSCLIISHRSEWRRNEEMITRFVALWVTPCGIIHI